MGCPSLVTGRSASVHLRFRFVRVVRAVRAGEAKLRGRMTIVVPIAGPPGASIRVLVRAAFRFILLLFISGLKTVGQFLCAGACLLLLFTWVLRNCRFFVRQYNTWWT